MKVLEKLKKMDTKRNRIIGISTICVVMVIIIVVSVMNSLKKSEVEDIVHDVIGGIGNSDIVSGIVVGTSEELTNDLNWKVSKIKKSGDSCTFTITCENKNIAQAMEKYAAIVQENLGSEEVKNEEWYVTKFSEALAESEVVEMVAEINMTKDENGAYVIENYDDLYSAMLPGISK